MVPSPEAKVSIAPYGLDSCPTEVSGAERALCAASVPSNAAWRPLSSTRTTESPELTYDGPQATSPCYWGAA
jgi:hypothetical protein